jgi:hypothetical protein
MLTHLTDPVGKPVLPIVEEQVLKNGALRGLRCMVTTMQERGVPKWLG